MRNPIGQLGGSQRAILVILLLLAFLIPCRQTPSADTSYFSQTNRKLEDLIASIGNVDQSEKRTLFRLQFERLTGQLDLDLSYKPKILEFSRLASKNSRYETYKFTFENKSGLPVPSLLLKPIHSVQKMPGIIALHQTSEFGKLEPAGISGKTELAYGKELAERGFVVIIPDYPGFGENKYHDANRGDTATGIENHFYAVTLLSKLHYVDKHKIGAIGHSLGGHNAIFLSALDTRIRAVVSNCGWTPFPYYSKGDLSVWTSQHYMPRIASVFQQRTYGLPIDFYDLTAMVLPRHLLTIAPRNDLNFSYTGVQHAEASIQAALRKARLDITMEFLYPAGVHEFPIEDREIAYRFLQRSLGTRKLTGN